MSILSIVDTKPNMVNIFGAGEGVDVGRILIQWQGKNIELFHLTIERSIPVDTRRPEDRIEKKIAALQWMVLTPSKELVLIEKNSLELSLEHAFPEEAPTPLSIDVRNLFKKVIVEPTLSHEDFHLVQRSLLFNSLMADSKAVCEHSEEISFQKHVDAQQNYAERVTQTVDWIDFSGAGFLKEIPWDRTSYVKIPHLPLPTRCFRDSKSGELCIDITAGIIEEGSGKKIKSVIRLTDGKVIRLVRAAPRKAPPQCPVLSNLLLQKNDCELLLRHEASVTSTLTQNDVPNIISFSVFSYEKEGKKKFRYMMERCETDLLEYTKSFLEGGYSASEDGLHPYLQMMVYFHLLLLDTLRHMHALGWVHRDLKPENVLLTVDKGIRLTDFSFCKRAHEQERMDGSPMYESPDFFRNILNDGPVSPATDMWAFGIMLYNGTSPREAPFENLHTELTQKVASYEEVKMSLKKGQKEPSLPSSSSENTISPFIVSPQQLQTMLESIHREIEELLSCLEQQIEIFREELKSDDVPISLLIRDLVAVDPVERPTAEEAFTRLMAIYQSS